MPRKTISDSQEDNTNAVNSNSSDTAEISLNDSAPAASNEIAAPAESEVSEETPAEKKTRGRRRSAKKETSSAQEGKRRGRKPKAVEKVITETVEKVSRRGRKKIIDLELPTQKEVVPTFTIQFGGKQTTYNEICNRVKSIITGQIHDLDIYLNTDDGKVYVVINKEINMNFPV